MSTVRSVCEIVGTSKISPGKNVPAQKFSVSPVTQTEYSVSSTRSNFRQTRRADALPHTLFQVQGTAAPPQIVDMRGLTGSHCRAALAPALPPNSSILYFRATCSRHGCSLIPRNQVKSRGIRDWLTEYPLPLQNNRAPSFRGRITVGRIELPTFLFSPPFV